MVANRLQAIVAGTLGYHSGMLESERMKAFAQAALLIKDIAAGKHTCELDALVLTHMAGIVEFDRMVGGLEKSMVQLAKQLPVASWVAQPEQRGFGLLMLAVVIGETGDLANYANPAKVWRRLGCAPFQKDNETLMGATWRSRTKGTKLSAEEWEEFGYSPRRRSIAYLIGVGLLKQNTMAIGTDDAATETETPTVGPYCRRYDESKAKLAAAHPDYPKGRCHNHGMLLATKLLLKNLWIVWHGDRSFVTEAKNAV
jgi:hypothetical protein